MTEDDVRRIVREEIARLVRSSSASSFVIPWHELEPRTVRSVPQPTPISVERDLHGIPMAELPDGFAGVPYDQQPRTPGT